MKYKFLEDIATADCAFEAYGKSFPKLFENAALALFEVMVETKKIKKVQGSKFKIQSKNLEDLLYDFLSELVFLKDKKGMIFSKFEVKIKPNKLEPRSYNLEAKIWGEKIDPQKHKLKVDVKAITYNLFEIKKKNDQLMARVVLDV